MCFIRSTNTMAYENMIDFDAVDLLSVAEKK